VVLSEMRELWRERLEIARNEVAVPGRSCCPRPDTAHIITEVYIEATK